MATRITRSALQRCVVHETVDGFCEIHNVTCCMACHQLSYKECRVIKIGDAAGRLIGRLKHLQDELHRMQSKDTEQTRDLCEIKEESELSSIRRFYADIRKTIDNLETEAIKEAKKAYMDVRSAVLDGDQKMAKIRAEADRLDQEISDIQMIQSISRLGQTEDKSHEGSALVADDRGSAGGNSECNSSSCEAAMRVEKASTVTMDTNHLLSVYKETLERLDEDHGDLCLMEARIDPGHIDTIRNLMGESCRVETRRNIIVECEDSVVQFVDDTIGSPLVVITYSPKKILLISQYGKLIREAVLTMIAYDLYVTSNKVFVTYNINDCVIVYRLDNMTETARFTVPSGGGCWGVDGISDKLVVACTKANRVCLLTYKGEITAKSNHKFDSPTFLVVSTNRDAVYVSELNSHTIVVLSADLLTMLRTIKHTDINNPRGPCMIDNHIYVASKSAHTVLRMDANGSNCSALLSVTKPQSVCYNARERLMVIGCYGSNIVTYRGNI